MSQVTVMDAAGTVLERRRIPSGSLLLGEMLARYPDPKKAVLEASYNWGPMYDWLAEESDEVVLAHPSKVRAIADARIKTDRIDSEILAHLLSAT